jgi:lysophospholipase L1-like esterase
MSLEGTAEGKTLVGSINKCETLTISAYGIAVKNGFEGTEAEWLASLKGAKGDPGDAPVKGVDYFDGEDGYTPVRGTDYWTPDDQQVMQDDNRNFIATELAKRNQLAPEFVDNIEECIDTTKLYVLPDGYIYAYMYAEAEIGGCTNLIDTASADFLTSSRINASNAVASTSNPNAFVSNFITAKSRQIIRIKGVTDDASKDTSPRFRILFCKEDGSALGGVYLYGDTAGAYSVHELVEISEDGVYKYQLGALANGTVGTYDATLAKIRVSGVATNGLENIVVTLDEEITEPQIVQQYQWVNTGHAFVPADYEDRIIALEAEDAKIRQEIDNLQEQIDSGAASAKSGARWFALGDSITEGWTSAADATAANGYKQFLNTNIAQRWVNIVAEKNGYQLTNYGVGGSGYYHAANNAKAQVDKIDFSECDLVTLAYGCNDWKYDGSIVGTEADIPQTVVATYNAHNSIAVSSDTAADSIVYKNGVRLTPTTDYTISGNYLVLTEDTTKGDRFDIYIATASMVSNMAYCIKKILRDNPYCKIFVITPINCRSLGTYATNWGINYAGTAGSGKSLEYVYAMQKAVCEEYGIELIDMTHNSIVNRENIKTVLADYVHPTVECHAVMARELAKKIAFQ